MSVTRFRKRSGTILGLRALDDALLRRVRDSERLASCPRRRTTSKYGNGTKSRIWSSRQHGIASVGVFTRPMPITLRAPRARVTVAVRVDAGRRTRSAPADPGPKQPGRLRVHREIETTARDGHVVRESARGAVARAAERTAVGNPQVWARYAVAETVSGKTGNLAGILSDPVMQRRHGNGKRPGSLCDGSAQFRRIGGGFRDDANDLLASVAAEDGRATEVVKGREAQFIRGIGVAVCVSPQLALNVALHQSRRDRPFRSNHGETIRLDLFAEREVGSSGGRQSEFKPFEVFELLLLGEERHRHVRGS